MLEAEEVKMMLIVVARKGCGEETRRTVTPATGTHAWYLQAPPHVTLVLS
jgi:hypothetical protein